MSKNRFIKSSSAKVSARPGNSKGRNPGFPDELATSAAGVLAAIQAANFQTNGAPFDPFLVKFAQPADFKMIWGSERGDTSIAFYQYTGTPAGGFLPLGDIAITNYPPGFNPYAPIMMLAQNSATPGTLINPTGFQWILDDKGSGNDNDLVYWWPIAPSGYKAMGICVTNGDAPDPSKYWCVAETYLQPAATTAYWNDAGSHWTSHSGNLSVPVMPSDSDLPEESLLLAPTTFLSDEYGSPQNSFCLVVSKLMLPITVTPVQVPPYDPTLGVGSSTAEGLSAVAVLPANAITDSTAGYWAALTPFYYLAAQPSWSCVKGFAAPEGGTYQLGITVGTSTTQSNSFEETTSVTLSAEVGVEAGPASAKISASYTNEMKVGTNASSSGSTETSEVVTINLPHSIRILLWQSVVDLVTYRTDGSALSSATYENDETGMNFQA